MERMPYQPELDRAVQVIDVSTPAVDVTVADWRREVPVLTGGKVTLRELRVSDATSLFAMITTDAVARFISPPPVSVEGFERFIEWAHCERAEGTYLCLAVVPEGYDTAIGIFQIRQLETGFRTAEWGFALGSEFWGTGVFAAAAALTLRLAFDTIGVHRLEARAALRNGRGNGALRKIGAVREGVLRRSFLKDGEWLDQMLYSILDSDWHRHQEVTWGINNLN